MRHLDRHGRLATILFTDIVGSSEVAADLGDRGSRTLIARHQALARKELKRFRAREIDTAGEASFAAFEGPADARDAPAPSPMGSASSAVEVRAGLDVGQGRGARPEARGDGRPGGRGGRDPAGGVGSIRVTVDCRLTRP